MPARAKSPPRVDDDGNRVGIGVLPGRADPEGTHANGSMESPPCVHPTAGHIPPFARAEHAPEAFLAAWPCVGGKLDASVELDLFETFREELDHRRACFLGSLGTDPDRDAANKSFAQRNAALSFSKKPSSAL
jgi:hypothetical protein